MPSPQADDRVVDLTYESSGEDAALEEDPDKENHFTIPRHATTHTIHAGAALRSDSRMTEATQGASSSLQRTNGRGNGLPPSRHSLVGPMARNSSSTPVADAGPLQRKSFTPTESIRSEESTSSATQQIRSIGLSAIQRFFPHGRSRRNLTSTPGSESSLFSPSLASTPSGSAAMPSSASVATIQPKRKSSIYKKREHIFHKEHRFNVDAFNKKALKRAVATAAAKINAMRHRTRQSPVTEEQMKSLALKHLAIKRIVDAENPYSASARRSIGEDMEQSFQRIMRQKEADAQSVLPLPPAKLAEIQRLKREERARLRRLRGVLGRPALPPNVSSEEEAQVGSALRKQGMIADIPGAEVNDRDIQKLRPGQWLNDEVINFYGNLILQRANEADRRRQEAISATTAAASANDRTSTQVEASPTPNNGKAKKQKRAAKTKPKRPYDATLDAYWRVHFFSSFFWENLKKRGFDGVKRWTRKVDIFSKDLVLFPINLGNAHWVCGAINIRKRRFEYYDSMGHRNDHAFELMRTYLSAEALDKKKKEIDLRSWHDVFSEETPQQENGYDCGVFATQTLEQISRRDPHTPIPLSPPPIPWKGENLDQKAERLSITSRSANGGALYDYTDEDGDDDDDDNPDEYEWNFGQSDMPYLRKRMIYEIYTKKLIDPPASL
ncbi:cysteine proteinase [Testicularia cyperi]|uniref:Cysteine proteinase n=1 Tax=Testicularia cyperi TaxID=1882483 RepID=A0A317XXP7_9BASI|nr:cysteine proteinase [Testicularia cyperi]